MAKLTPNVPYDDLGDCSAKVLRRASFSAHIEMILAAHHVTISA
jgi:hypothetical protein